MDGKILEYVFAFLILLAEMFAEDVDSSSQVGPGLCVLVSGHDFFDPSDEVLWPYVLAVFARDLVEPV